MSTPANNVDSAEIRSARKAECQSMAKGWCESITGLGRRISIQTVKQGWGELQHGISIQGGLMCLNGKNFTHGLGTHADSELILREEEGIAGFSAVVGMDQNNLTRWGVAPRLIFSVEVAGQEVWRSEEMGPESVSPRIDLKFAPGTKEITLKCWTVDGSWDKAHGNWADAYVETATGEKIKVGIRGFTAIPFSFVIDGKPSSELLGNWKKTAASRPGKKAGETDHVVSWTNPETELECRMELTEFDDFPALEWVLYFRNGGKSDTPIIENVQALDMTWSVRPKFQHENLKARVNRSRGSTFSLTDFELVQDELIAGDRLTMGSGGGRPSQNWLPFFNVDLGDKFVFTAVGWSGQWASAIDHAKQGDLHIIAGMEKTHLKLHPGEEIRTPRMMQLLWKEDLTEGHNVLRQFLLHHHTPHLHGKPVTGPFTIAHWGGMGTQLHLDRIAVYKREKLPMDYLWVDAGWYGLNSSYSPDEFLGDWSMHTGDWRVNPKAHPAGLRPIADAAKDAGMKFMLWVEPTRAVKGTHWAEEHPDWFLGGEYSNLLLNLGNPEALQGCIELISNLIAENDISLFREDFNIEPLDFWRNNDTPDRQGMTEIRFTEGVYKMWDTLLERHPGLVIDNCSSGGRRIELETISRSVALWRSDLQCAVDHSTVGTQSQFMSLNYWIPLHGSGTWGAMPTKEKCSTYLTRGTMGPAFMLSTFTRESNPIQDDYPWDWFRKMCADYLRARPLFTGDYYPLTSVSLRDSDWAVYQMDRPDLGEGFVMALRRKSAPWDRGSFKLYGIDPEASYEVEDADAGSKKTRSGKSLQEGLEITLTQPESSALVFYRKF